MEPPYVLVMVIIWVVRIVMMDILWAGVMVASTNEGT